MKEHKMTDWDAGQVIVSLTDELWASYTELKSAGYLNQANSVRRAAELLGDSFNKFHTSKSHSFGLKGSNHDQP